MTKNVIILFLFLPTFSLGQDFSDSLLLNFYNKTIHYYFTEGFQERKGQMKFDKVLIETEFDTSKLIKNVGQYNFKYITKKTRAELGLKKPYKRYKGRKIYKFTHSFYGGDTLDFLLTTWTILEVTRKKIEIGKDLGGHMSYIPKCRFIYDRNLLYWRFVKAKDLVRPKNDGKKNEKLLEK